ncbi:MAG: glycoside hydrolase domain-containing protein [Patescibacteria group bacterium]
MYSAQASRFIGFDTSTYCSPQYARILWDAGYRLAIRYIRRDKHVNAVPDLNGLVSLSLQERDELLSIGFKITCVQFAKLSLVPSTAEGTAAAEAGVYNAKALGFKAGDTIWYDFEWSTSQNASAVMSYIDAIGKYTVANGFKMGSYVGPNCSLSGDQWYARPYCTAYWKSGAIVPWVTQRAFQLIQGVPITVGKTSTRAGINIDQDIVCYDNKNEIFSCLAA